MFSKRRNSNFGGIQFVFSQVEKTSFLSFSDIFEDDFDRVLNTIEGTVMVASYGVHEKMSEPCFGVRRSHTGFVVGA
jgi:hypothetical protein